MYYCQDCGMEFEKGELKIETHRLALPPFERVLVCPGCEGERFRERVDTHCRCCGAKLRLGIREYCGVRCRENGRKMWERELRRRRLHLTDPLTRITREIEQYNRGHGTHISYGQYVALVRPAQRERRNKK